MMTYPIDRAAEIHSGRRVLIGYRLCGGTIESRHRRFFHCNRQEAATVSKSNRTRTAPGQTSPIYLKKAAFNHRNETNTEEYQIRLEHEPIIVARMTRRFVSADCFFLWLGLGYFSV